MNTMRPHQERAVTFHFEKMSSYNALKPGAGKTLITLSWMEQVLATDKNIKSFLVMSPLLTTLMSWPNEIRKWKPDMSFSICHGPNKDSRLDENTQIKLINFEALPWLLDAVVEYHKKYKCYPFQGLVIDEGSKMKNPSTVRFKTFKRMLPLFSQWRLILSGTPAPNTLMDLWSQYFILDGGVRLEPNITRFRTKYFVQGFNRFTWSIKSPEAEDQVSKAVKDITFYVDPSEYSTLQPIVYNDIKVPLPLKVRETYKELEDKFFLTIEDVTVETPTVLSLGMKLRQLMQGGMYGETPDGEREVAFVHNQKVKMLKSYMDSVDEPVLCAFQFSFELEIMKKVLGDFPFINRWTKKQDALRYMEEWNRGEIPFLACQPQSVSHGLNIQFGARLIVWLGLTWSSETFEQFNARLHREGQKEQVVVSSILFENTIDVKVQAALRSKIKGQRRFLNFIKGE